jgi:hypothetical protein
MTLTTALRKAARISADGRAIRRSLETGSVRPLARRAKNRAVGHALGTLGFWSRLWR